MNCESVKTVNISKKELRVIASPKLKYSIIEIVFMVNNLIFSQCIKGSLRNNVKLQKKIYS